jgi:hypothetical protein
MKVGENMIVLLVALAVAILAFALVPSTDYVPYNQGKVYNYAGKYESFTGTGSGTGSVSASVSETPSTNSATYPSVGNTLLTQSGNMTSGLGITEPFESANENLRDLKWGPLRDSEVIDKFSQVHNNGTDGAKGCISSGLSNSGGYICLTPELVNLLSTRGGNATGKDSQIGAPAS